MKIILDSPYDYDEDIFEYGKCKLIIGGSWLSIIHKMASERHIQLVLSRAYLSAGEFSKEDLILSEGYTYNTERLIKTGATPFIVLLGESPNVDWKFYAFIYRHTKRYENSFLFPGAKYFTHKNNQFHPFFWPNDVNYLKWTTHNPVKVKKKLVMIVSNKKRQTLTTNRNLMLIAMKGVFLSIVTKIIPSLKLRDLYDFRMKAIEYFSDKAYFELFGKGWDNTNALTHSEKKAIKKLQPSIVENKLSVLSNYEFALCFENCVYPGYITEKIFDCFFSNCIPIYYGAPDIGDYIPPNTFVDARLFKNFNALDDFLTQISQEKIIKYQENIKLFLSSKMFERFTDLDFSKKMMAIIDEKRQFSNSGKI